MIWKSFWENLNIRKAMALMVVGSYIAYIFITGQDMGIKDIALMIISYFFGYANGQKMSEQLK